jgi:hypothetical protein
MAPREAFDRLRALSIVAVAAAALSASVACTGGGGPQAAAPSASTSPAFTASSAGCAGPISSPTVDGSEVAAVAPTVPVETATTTPDGGGDPFAALGARQHAGPTTTTTLIPQTPVSAVVATPPNPDIGTPAATPNQAAPIVGQAASRPVVIELPGPADATTTTYPVSIVTAELCTGAQGSFP